MPTAREWLRDNGYADIAGDIDEVIAVWRAAGKTTRRDWWDVLAGGADGTTRRVGGREWPVLAVARRRQGLPPAENELSRSEAEDPPPVRSTGRWASTGSRD